MSRRPRSVVLSRSCSAVLSGAEAGQLPVQVCFTLDQSGSITSTGWTSARGFVATVITDLARQTGGHSSCVCMHSTQTFRAYKIDRRNSNAVFDAATLRTAGDAAAGTQLLSSTQPLRLSSGS